MHTTYVMLLQAVGPEAKATLESLGGTFFVITVSRMALIGLLLGGFTLAQLLIKRLAVWQSQCPHAHRSEGQLTGHQLTDQIEMVETVLFSMQVTISIRTSLQMLGQEETANADVSHWINALGFYLAIITVLLQLLFAAKYALAVRTLLRKQEDAGRVRENLLTVPSFLRSRSLAPNLLGISRSDEGYSTPPMLSPFSLARPNTSTDRGGSHGTLGDRDEGSAAGGGRQGGGEGLCGWCAWLGKHKGNAQGHH